MTEKMKGLITASVSPLTKCSQLLDDHALEDTSISLIAKYMMFLARGCMDQPLLFH
jgi:hypothetical protein